eukprot:symbB.v1.2.006069.t1/scaffold332.1/size322744/4
MPESPTNQGIPIGDVEELKKQLERKIAKVAELELELDQAKKDLRAAQRTIDEKDLLLQEKARKDADKAKHMAELMEKLRKSEEQEEKLAGKLYKAEEKIKQLKEQIRELKNQLGMPQEQSEEEVEEEVDTSTVFMSRYYLRAKNSGKPRWMLLSEDAKYKSQKKNQDETKQVMGPGGVPLPGGQVGGWTSAHHQPQEASRAFNFLRKAPGSNSKASQVRLQYSFTQASSLADPGPDASPTAGSHSSAFSRMNTFHGGPMQDTSPLSPGHVDQRLQHANSMPFQMGGPGVASPGGALGGFQQGGFGSFSRQSTSNSFVPNGPNGPGVFVPRNNTPPQAHPIYSAGGGAVFNNASWRSGQAPSTGPAFTSTMSGGSMMSNPFRPDMGMHGMQSPSGMRLGTPPTGHPGLTNFMAGTTIPRDVGPAAPALAPTLTATASQSVALGGESVTNSLSLAGFSQTIAKLSPSASPGSTKPSDEEGPTSSAGLPLTLSESETTSRMLQHSVSSMSMSPSSSRMAHVSLAMVDPMSPQERPMLQLIPQRQDLPSMDFSEVVSPFRSGSLRQSASWSAFPSSWALREDLGEGSGQTVPNVVTLTMANGAHSDAAASPSDVDISSDRVPSKGEGSKSQVLKPLHQARTMPIDIDFATASAPLRFWRGHDVSADVLRNAEGPVGSKELGPTASLLLVLAYIVAGLLLRRASWMTTHRCELLRSFTFKVLFPIYLLRTLWSINFSLALAVVLPISLVFHILWFFLSQQLSSFTPEAKEVQNESGQPHMCLAGWALLMAQGENMAFTYPLLAEAASPVESLASAMMWDLGANVWLCQGFLWGIATIYSPQVQAGTYRAICEPDIETEDLDIETTDLMEATFPALMRTWKTSWAAGTKEVAVKAVMDSILLRACLAGICYLDGTDGFMGFLGRGGGYPRVLENF